MFNTLSYNEVKYVLYYIFSRTSRRMPSRGADMYKPSAYVTYDIDAVHTALFNK